jgi:3-oxoacyl-[acyl-carrier-protein] synthase II
VQSSDAGLVVTGVGLTTSLGAGVEANWRALVSGASGMRPVTSFDTQASLVKDAGEAPGHEGLRQRERVTAHLLDACLEALRAAGLERVPDPARAALVLGSSLAADATSEDFWPAFHTHGPAAADYDRLPCYGVEPRLAELCAKLGVEGEVLLLSNACAAGASSVAAAADLIRLGRADLAIAVGYDGLDRHTFAGFASIKALAPGKIRPFTTGRAGMKLGDGFAAIVLEREGTPRRAIARLSGYGESADAHHLTQPDPEGRGAALAMRRALDMAGLEPAAIDYVNAHATATPANDLAELRALRAVFGERLSTLALSASKPAFGHTLGGAGTVEAAVTLLVLRDQLLPPTLDVGELEAGFAPLDTIPERRAQMVRHALSSSFGFGGCNAALVFSRANDG